MHRLAVLFAGLSLAVLTAARPASAAAQLSIWPADYTFGTTPGQYSWSATSFGLGFEQSLAPFTSLRTNLTYGSATNIKFNGSALSGYTGGVVVADAALRVGVPAGPVALSAYAGFGGLFFNATGSAATDRVVLQSSGTRLGVEAGVAPAPGVTLRGSYTVTTGLTTNASISMSSPAVAGSFSGAGSGNEYEVALVLSPVPLTSVYAGYRSGTQQISWSGGGGNTTTTFSGWMVGVDLRF